MPYAIIYVRCYFDVHYRMEIIFIPDLSENMVLFLTGWFLLFFFFLFLQEVALVLAAILVFLLAFYAFFYLNISNEVDLDLDPDEN